MGELRRPGRGADLAVRRDLPGQRLDVHLRHGCQGVLTGPAPELAQGCCSYGAHFTGRKDADNVERGGQDARPGRLAVPRQGTQGRGQEAGRRRPRHPAGGRRLHLPQPAGVRRRARLRPPRRGGQAAGSATSSSSPRSAGSSRCGARTRRRPTVGSPRWCASGTAGTGARAVTSSTGGAPRTRRPSSATSRSTGRMRTELETMAGKKVYKRLAAYLDERTAPGADGHPAPPPDRPPLTGRGPGPRRPAGAGAVLDYSARGRPRRGRRPVGRCRGSRRSRPRWPGTTRRACPRAPRRTRGNAGWPWRPTASGCALLRSGDGVPSSRDQLLAPPGVDCPLRTARPGHHLRTMHPV